MVQRYSASAPTDLLTVQLAAALGESFGEPVTVTRKSRAGGSEGALFVSRAAPDGRTLLFAGSGRALSHHERGLIDGGKTRSSLTPIALVARMPVVFIASGNAPYVTMADLVHHARHSPRATAIGSAGERSVAHLALELFRLKTAVPVQHVPYNGGAGALQAIAAGQSSAAVAPLPAVLPYLAGGRVKPLAIADNNRHPGLPDVPTMAEAGVADVEIAGWIGVLGPATMSNETCRRLNAALAHSLQSRQTTELFSTFGFRLDHRSADAFAEVIRREQAVRASVERA